MVKKNITKEQVAEKVTDKDVAFVEKTAKKLFDLMGVEVTAEVEKDDKNNSINVNIKTPSEAGLLIGNKGRTLAAIQYILGGIVRQHEGVWKRVVVNIEDWREKEERRLQDLALQASQRAKERGEPQPIYNLTAGQRRVIHMFLAEDKDVTTESRGEGNERYLVVLPNK